MRPPWTILVRLFAFVLLGLMACDAPAQHQTEAPRTNESSGSPEHRAEQPSSFSTPAYFMGEIYLPAGQVLDFQVRLETEDQGGYLGFLDIPKQGVRQQPLSEVTASGNQIEFSWSAVGAAWKYSGNEDDSQCEFSQGGQTFSCAMESLTAEEYTETTALPRPQTPVGPFPYREEDIVVQSGEIRLSGTLTLPTDSGKHPAVLLLNGSGAQDRNSTIEGHQPFLVIADALTRAGFVVLRLDDRGVGQSQGDLSQATLETLAEDAEAALTALSSHSEVDSTKMGVIGHSEGALVAAQVASQANSVSFMVSLAGPGLPMRQVLLQQTQDLMERAGVPNQTIEAKLTWMKQLHEMMLLEDAQIRRARLVEHVANDPAAPPGSISSEQAESIVAGTIDTPHMRSLTAAVPRSSFEKIRVPVLALCGSLDVQVNAEHNLPAIRSALKKARNRRSSVESVDGLNHLLQPAKTGLPDEYVEIETTLDRATLNRIVEWAEERTGASK